MRLDQMKNYLRIAYLKALLSPDPSTQNGAVILRRNPDGGLERISTACNDFPMGQGDKGVLLHRETKYKLVEHAERLAIYFAALQGGSLKGAIMVCPWAACHECARAIIACGIDSLIVHKERMRLTHCNWKQGVKEAKQMLSEAGVAVYSYEGPVDAKSILVNGKGWCPASLSWCQE